MPVPPQLVGVLQTFFSVYVEPDGGARGLGGGVGEDDAGGEIPDGALATGFYGFEIALDMGPVPVGFLLLYASASFFLHH